MSDDAPAPAPVQPDDWSPPKTDEATGVAMIGDYPANHRLRIEALKKARRKTDPDGVVTPEMIAESGE